jgi:ATP-dependent exoDNAse (exonuclease V) alpha subunit
VREGRGVAQALAYLNQQVRANTADALILCAKRGRAGAINQTRLAQLKPPEYKYPAHIEGKISDEELKAFQSPRELFLRKGAKVMFTQNDQARRWVNGTLGQVTSLAANEVTVDIGHAEVKTGQAVWEIQRLAWDKIKRKLSVQVVGSYTQIPLMLAWATTVHKAQGLTLETVHLDLNSPGWCHGLVYTALSRCRTLEGLSLQRPLEPADVSVDQALWDWYRRTVTGQAI